MATYIEIMTYLKGNISKHRQCDLSNNNFINIWAWASEYISVLISTTNLDMNEI